MSDVTIVTKSDTCKKSAARWQWKKQRKRLRNLKKRIKGRIEQQGPQDLAVQDQQVEQDYKHQSIPDPEKFHFKRKSATFQLSPISIERGNGL